ncbi:MAG: hypothetical protein Q4B80_04875 [Aerococcaceae bacterium]|nr:hypothetical protein [Aerococcaceae bacterium]
MLGNFHRGNVVVLFSLFFAAVGIGFAMTGEIQFAMISLVVATIADMFVYQVSSAFETDEATQSFANEFETLTDVVIFGILPAVIYLQVMNANIIGLLILAAYILAVIVRVAHFNRASRFIDEVSDDKTQGLPIEFVGIALPVLTLLGYILPLIVLQILLTLLMGALAFAYVSKHLFPKIQRTYSMYVILVNVLVVVIMIWKGNILR